MEISRKWRFSCLLLGLLFLATTLQGVQGEVESKGPSESECRPYIEKAIKELETGEPESVEPGAPVDEDTTGDVDVEGTAADDSEHDTSAGEDDIEKGDNIESTETQDEQTPDASVESHEQHDETSSETKDEPEEEAGAAEEEEPLADEPAESKEDEAHDEAEETTQSGETHDSQEAQAESVEAETAESQETAGESHEAAGESQEAADELQEAAGESQEAAGESQEAADETQEAEVASQETAEGESQEAAGESQEAAGDSQETVAESQEAVEAEAEPQEAAAESQETAEESHEAAAESHEDQPEEESHEEAQQDEAAESHEQDEPAAEESHETQEVAAESQEAAAESQEATSQETEAPAEPESETEEADAGSVEKVESAEAPEDTAESAEKTDEAAAAESAEVETETAKETSVEEEVVAEQTVEAVEAEPESAEEPREEVPEEDLILDIDIPEHLRPRDQLDQLLKLDESNTKSEISFNRISEITLRELKRLYEGAIKPLETLYKYRDLSNRHFGDSEIFSKPLVLFMGPWSGGKSSIINYLLDNEYNTTSLRTGAEPSPAYFNLLMHGDEPEVLDGTQLAADFTFAGLQKFGQGLEERLRGLKLPSKLLEKINIVEIPGILEVRKQVSRVFPFNDACQWFIDRADIIFLVYDPSKLDVGPETEAILDQLKGREHQTRIILNKADQVKPEELMRVQGALIWNISPLMSSAQPPVMYTTSLWSRPYETWAPVRLLQAQERAFLRDLRSAVDKRIENKISSARRFAVRVRNHAKMVDCYLTTYYNHKSVFGNRKQVADQIIEHPQDYHIYEGLSTLTNISRYDLPDPDVYRDFFRLNPLYDFQQLSATCTYFRGCPINKLDVAIAYDLPELVGKHKKLVETALAEFKTES